MQRTNLSKLNVEYDESDPEGYRAGMARFGPSIGASKLGASVYELPPGQSVCPYHYEYPEEETAVTVYPDSDKLGVWTGNKDDNVIVRRGSHVDYYDGEIQDR